MRDVQLIRRYELYFVLSAAVVYVIRRLIREVDRIDYMVEMALRHRVPSSVVWRNLNLYDHTLNNNVPLIAGVCLLVGAWYVFHNLAYPLINDRTNDQQAIIYLVIAGLLLLASTFIYYYFKLQVRFQQDGVGDIIGLKVYSLFRKRTVLAEAIGFGIVFGMYEIGFQYYQYLVRKIGQESESHFRTVSYLLASGLSVLVLNMAFRGDDPGVLWQRGTRSALLFSGITIQILFLQAFFYSHILPLLRASSTSEIFRAGRIATYMLVVMPFLKSSTTEVALASRIATFLLLIIVANMILWGASTGFHYDNRDPILLMFIVLTGAVSIAFLRQALQKEKIVLQTQVSAKSAELSSLQAQINPHFLFNALNSLYATALKENSEKTADGIQKLGDMMRFMLQENNRDRIPLDKEIEYLRNYIEIQRMRIDETHPIEVRVNIQEPSHPIYLAPMMLTPFVENAFKHGISLRHPSWIYITLTLDDTRLYFKVHNSRHSNQNESADRHDPEENQGGVGLENVRKRLALIYPGRHQLDIQQSEQDYFVSLTLVYW
ncbi:sensor histidine kinase [Spirosoma litoris]